VSVADIDHLAAHFDRLCVLSEAEQLAEMAELELDADERRQLLELLEADRREGDPILQAVSAGAANFHRSPVARLGAWRLIREIGAGGMGTVFLAERADGQFDRQVAIKLLRGFPTQDSMRRLRQERQILAGLDHPNIARLLDGGETDDGQPWLAMEFVEGTSVLEHAGRHASTVGERLHLFDAMLNAIEHAHQHLIIHRDLKPANVMVSSEGIVKLLDFGIARLIDESEQGQQATSTRVFSRGYSSPEQREGRTITTASDIYSLGVMLHELLTGRRTANEEASALLEPLSLDADLAGILARASASKPEDRYVSAGEFRDDLDRYREGRPVRAARMTRAYRLRKFVGRHRLGVAVAVLATLIIAAFVWRLDRERERAMVAESAARRALLASERDAASARRSLQFLTDAFSAASPETAMSRQVGVRDLLDAARAKLGKLQDTDPRVSQQMQRLLAVLYSQLGEARTARDLMRDGLAGIEPVDAAEALRLANDYAEYSMLLGFLDEGPAAAEAANTAAAWREQYAPDDILLRIGSLQTLAMVQHRSGDDTRAIELLQQAYRLGIDKGIVDIDARIESAQLLANLIATRGDCDEALAVADEGLALADARLPGDAPSRLPLMRARASALNACGRQQEAEPVLRAAMALQARVVASGGTRMMGLANDLAITLNDLGRYQEAAEMLQQSDKARDDVGLGKIDDVISLANQGGILENAGDYARALSAFTQGIALLDADHVEADHQVRRRLERSYARTLGLTGQHDRAWTMLTDLRARCARVEGEDSGEYAMLTWQLALLAQRMNKPEAGLALLDEAERRWAALVPSTHPVFAHAQRARAQYAMQRGNFDQAEASLLKAIASFESDGNTLPIDLAIARSELAELRIRQDRKSDARVLLQQSLPVLRKSLLPEEIYRARAERLATSLRMGP
jgi:eukaryotic-like serine/threonine-protein kinase